MNAETQHLKLINIMADTLGALDENLRKMSEASDQMTAARKYTEQMHAEVMSMYQEATGRAWPPTRSADNEGAEIVSLDDWKPGQPEVQEELTLDTTEETGGDPLDSLDWMFEGAAGRAGQ